MVIRKELQCSKAWVRFWIKKMLRCKRTGLRGQGDNREPPSELSSILKGAHGQGRHREEGLA